MIASALTIAALGQRLTWHQERGLATILMGESANSCPMVLSVKAMHGAGVVSVGMVSVETRSWITWWCGLESRW